MSLENWKYARILNCFIILGKLRYIVFKVQLLTS